MSDSQRTIEVTGMSSWALAVTAPHREAAVSRMLTFWNFDHHVFRERKQIVCRGSIVERLSPIFPGYVFVDARGAWDIVHEIIGVVGFVRFGEHVATISNEIVDELIAQADADGILPLNIPPVVSRFTAGDLITVTGANVLAGHTGIFQRMLLPDQAIIDLNWMGRWVPICVDERELELVAALTTTKPEKQHRKRRRHHRRQTSHIATLPCDPRRGTCAVREVAS